MKTFYTALLCFLLAFIASSAMAQCTGCTITNKSSNQTIKVGSGETLCITTNFKGSISSFPADATICISPGITFEPSSFSNSGGTINNYGTFKIQSLSVNDRFTLNNYGTVDIPGSFNGNNNITIQNMAGSKFYGGSISLNSGSAFRNSGAAYFSESFTSNAANSVTNNPEARLYIGGSLTVNGSWNNIGYLRVKGDVTLNSGASVINQCSFVIGGNFSNNTLLKNTGNILLTKADANFSANGNIYNGPSGFIQGHSFSQNGEVTGGGNFRFTGTTTSNGKFGVDDDNYSINFYDATLANSQKFMDMENTSYENVTKNKINAKDTNVLLINCGLVEASVLPLKLTSFSGNETAGKVQLQWQVADNETGAYFDLEKSANGKSFQSLSLLFTTEKQGEESYHFKDGTPMTGKVFYRLKMVNKDKTFSYSQVLFFGTQKEAGANLTLLTNPVQNAVTFNYTSSGNEAADIAIYNISGIKVYASKSNMQKGVNSLSINTTLSKGLYILEVSNNGNQQTTKFIKQ